MNDIFCGEKMFYRFIFLTFFALAFFVGCETGNTSDSEIQSIDFREDTSTDIPVEAMVVKETKVEQKLPLTGVLEPNNSVDIVAEVSGKVIGIKKELGDYVSSGNTLVLIDDIIPQSQLKQAEAQVLSTKNNLKILKSNLQSDKILFENKDISELEYQNSQLTVSNAEAQHLSALAVLSAAQKTFDDTKIKSPISGFVSRKNIDFGSMVSMGTSVYRVVDLSVLKLKVSLPQELVNKVKLEDKAQVFVSALNEEFNGMVKRISPQANETTGGFNIEIHIANIQNKIKAGMTAKIELTLSNNENVLAIPDYAVVSKNEEKYVYKINGEFAELIKIKAGESVGENIIIEEGITIGDKIVTVGMKNLGLKTKIKVEHWY